MVRYRLEVGHTHGVQAKHIVGAIANEAGLDGRDIHNIDIHDDYSTVDLPEGMPNDLFQHLRKVWVCSRQLHLSVMGGDQPVPARRTGKPAGKPKSKTKHKAKTKTKSKSKTRGAGADS